MKDAWQGPAGLKTCVRLWCKSERGSVKVVSRLCRYAWFCLRLYKGSVEGLRASYKGFTWVLSSF